MLKFTEIKESKNVPKTLIIDPPEGWRYGFPKPIPNEMVIANEEIFSKWLTDNGYPADRLFEALRYSRYWEKDLE